MEPFDPSQYPRDADGLQSLVDTARHICIELEVRIKHLRAVAQHLENHVNSLKKFGNLTFGIVTPDGQEAELLTTRYEK